MLSHGDVMCSVSRLTGHCFHGDKVIGLTWLDALQGIPLLLCSLHLQAHLYTDKITHTHTQKVKYVVELLTSFCV